jgi:hypothetical protein
MGRIVLMARRRGPIVALVLVALAVVSTACHVESFSTFWVENRAEVSLDIYQSSGPDQRAPSPMFRIAPGEREGMRSYADCSVDLTAVTPTGEVYAHLPAKACADEWIIE